MEKRNDDRKFRLRQHVLVEHWWYVVDNRKPTRPRLIRKEFKSRGVAEFWIKENMLKSLDFDVISGTAAAKFKLRFHDRRRQNLRSTYAKHVDYKNPLLNKRARANIRGKNFKKRKKDEKYHRAGKSIKEAIQKWFLFYGIPLC